MPGGGSGTRRAPPLRRRVPFGETCPAGPAQQFLFDGFCPARPVAKPGEGARTIARLRESDPPIPPLRRPAGPSRRDLSAQCPERIREEAGAEVASDRPDCPARIRNIFRNPPRHSLIPRRNILQDASERICRSAQASIPSGPARAADGNPRSIARSGKQMRTTGTEKIHPGRKVIRSLSGGSEPRLKRPPSAAGPRFRTSVRYRPAPVPPPRSRDSDSVPILWSALQPPLR